MEGFVTQEVKYNTNTLSMIFVIVGLNIKNDIKIKPKSIVLF